MKEEFDTDWEGFLTQLPALKGTATHHLLFRGHGDSRWSLDTTLERRGRERMLVRDYYRLAGRVQPQLESFTGLKFEMPVYPEIEKLVSEYDSFSLALSFGGFPGYSYLIYARHHGFPSPFIDWTRSPYIAAFFAFADEQPKVTSRSIYVWSQPRMRVGGTNRPELTRLGPFVAAHQRHVLQQCSYTVCPTFDTKDLEWRFTSHEAAFADDEESPDVAHRLWKFNIPSSERLKVLRFLDEFNLNAYSLFGSQESLMQTLALREFDLREEYPLVGNADAEPEAV